MFWGGGCSTESSTSCVITVSFRITVIYPICRSQPQESIALWDFYLRKAFVSGLKSDGLHMFKNMAQSDRGPLDTPRVLSNQRTPGHLLPVAICIFVWRPLAEPNIPEQ